MAFYTDYTGTVTYATSWYVTQSALSNAVADLLVAHAGFTLVQHATEGVASSTTNYAEVVKGGSYIRIYGSGASRYELTYVLSYTSGSGSINSNSFAFNSSTFAMRFYNTKSGCFVQGYSNNGVWSTVCFSINATRILNGASEVILGVGVVSSAVACSDGLGVSYYLPLGQAYYTGFQDVDATQQILIQGSVGLSSTNQARRYMLYDFYFSSNYIVTGIFQIGTRYFLHFNDMPYLAIELNP